jgi:hypothetical protein
MILCNREKGHRGPCRNTGLDSWGMCRKLVPARRKPRRRRRKKEAYPRMTATARALYRGCFGEPMPKGWKVEWVGFMRGVRGLCCYGEKRILLNMGDVRQGNDALRTLVHEFIHVRFRGLRHGKEFRRLQASALANLWRRAAEGGRGSGAAAAGSSPVPSTIDNGPDLTAEDERLLDLAWASVAQRT